MRGKFGNPVFSKRGGKTAQAVLTAYKFSGFGRPLLYAICG